MYVFDYAAQKADGQGEIIERLYAQLLIRYWDYLRAATRAEECKDQPGQYTLHEVCSDGARAARHEAQNLAWILTGRYPETARQAAANRALLGLPAA